MADSEKQHISPSHYEIAEIIQNQHNLIVATRKDRQTCHSYSIHHLISVLKHPIPFMECRSLHAHHVPPLPNERRHHYHEISQGRNTGTRTVFSSYYPYTLLYAIMRYLPNQFLYATATTISPSKRIWPKYRRLNFVAC